MSRRVHAHSRSGKDGPKPFRPAKELPAPKPARANAIRSKASRPKPAPPKAPRPRSTRPTATRPVPTGEESTPKQPTSALTRRSRIPVALAALFAVAVLATSFPLSGLLSQRHQLSAAASQLSQLRHSNQLLAEQQSQLSSKTEINRLARQDYQLVAPGQTLYDVLPPAGSGSTVLPGGTQSGDPAHQPLVDPSQAPDMAPDPGLPQVPTTTGPSTADRASSSRSATATGPATFWGRVSTTLQFWK